MTVSNGALVLEKPFLPFERFLTREDFFICDGSVISDGGWYRTDLYNIGRFSEFDPRSIEGPRDTAEAFLGIVSKDNVLVTPGISREIFNLIDLINNKLKFLDNQRKTSLMRNGKGLPLYEPTPERTAFVDLYNLFRRAHQEAKRAEFYPPKKNLYNFLERLVLSITENTDAKELFQKSQRGYERTQKRPDSHTDEQIVAAALYLSIFENKSTGILTRDSDIKKILYRTLSYCSQAGREEYKEMFDSAIKKGVAVYYVEDMGRNHLKYSHYVFNSERPVRIDSEEAEAIEADVRPFSPF